MLTQLFVAAFLAVSAQTALAADCTRSYTIQAGDYCDKISQAQNVSTYQLAVVNSDSVNSDCTNLTPGQSLCLAKDASEDCKTTYVVVADDTCDGIASKNSVNSTILFLNNPQIDQACSNIYLGEVLCTSTTVQVSPVPASGVKVDAPGTVITVTPTATPVAVNTPAAAAAPIPATPTPASAASDDNGDVEDCEDDSDPAPVTPAAPATPTAPATSTDDNNNDEDDADLPFCDEI